MNDFVTALVAVTVTFFFFGAVLRKRAPRIAALSLGNAILFALLAALELVLGVARVARPAIDIEYPDHYYFTDANGVQKPSPGANHLVARWIKDGSVHYDVVYTIDGAHRRVSPSGPGPFSRYVLFIGDSFTFGDGVQDDETLPAAFARLHEDTRVYNYGFHGAGPYDVLARLETTAFRDEIPETSGVVVYTMIDEHVLRTRDYIQGAFYRGKKMQYEQRPDGSLVRCGPWAVCHPWRHRILATLSRSQVLKLLRFEFPLSLTKRDFDRTAGVLCRIRDVVATECPGAEFVVVFFPGCRVGEALIPRLRACSVRTVDLAESFDGLSPPHVLAPEDRHPTPDAYRRTAALLSDGLNSR